MWQRQEHMMRMSTVTWFVAAILSIIPVFRSALSTIKQQSLKAATQKHAPLLAWVANKSRRSFPLHGECRKALTYLSFALNQGWNKDGHLVCFWQWKTLDSSVRHIEAKRSFSYIQFHSRERNVPWSKFDTFSCGVLRQCIAWYAPPAPSSNTD